MRLFRVLFATDIAVALVVGSIFCIGLLDTIHDGHVDRDDLLLWPPLIAGMAAVLIGGWRLRVQGKLRAANLVLLIMAVPGLLAAMLLVGILVALSRPGAFR